MGMKSTNRFFGLQFQRGVQGGADSITGEVRENYPLSRMATERLGTEKARLRRSKCGRALSSALQDRR